MKSATNKLLVQLKNTAWFTEVGKPLPESFCESVLLVSSWEEAINCCGSIEWENFTLEQSNQLTTYLDQYAHDDYQKWNEIVQSVKEAIIPLVKEKIDSLDLLGHHSDSNVEELFQLFDAIDGKRSLKNAVEWDLLGACMELEYSDVRVPGFFCGLMEWYLRGRFPCGWGERDEGDNIVLLEPQDEEEYDPNEPDWLKLVLANQKRLYLPQIKLPVGGKLVVY